MYHQVVTPKSNAQMIGYLMGENKDLRAKIEALEKQGRIQDGLYCVLLELLISSKQVFTKEELTTLCEKHAQKMIHQARSAQRIEVAAGMKDKIKNIKESLEAKKV